MTIRRNLRITFIVFALLSQSQLISAQNRDLLIVTFGNSTTAARKGIDKVYAVRINEMLNEAGINNRVINSGAGGSHSGSVKDNDFTRIEHGMDRFDRTVLSHHPDWVTLNFGLNDAWQDKGITGASRIPVEQYKKNITYFIDQIRKDNGKIILLTPNPIGSKHEKWRYERVKLYMKAARKLARTKDVYFINSWKLFYRYTRKDPKGIDSLLPDAIHPNDMGHQLIAEKIVEIIVKSRK